MTTLAEVRDGLATRIDSIDGLRVYKLIPDSADFPAALIQPPTIPDYRSDLALGHFEAEIEIALLVPAAADRQQLDLYVLLERGPGSVFAAIEEDRSLGGLDVDVHARSARPLGLQEIGGVKCYGAAVTVQVFLGGI
jgi:hypothetical protein